MSFLTRPSMFGAALAISSLLAFSPDESNTAVADPTATGPANPTPTPPVELKSPNALEFCTIYNSSANREEALTKFKEQGFEMTYGAMVARYKSYTNPQRQGGAIALKKLPPSPRGRRINAGDINAKLAELAAAEVAKGNEQKEGEQAKA